MKRYGFTEANMDDAPGIVQLAFYNNRLWYEYIWSKPDLADPDALSSTIVDEQVHWNYLTAIIRQYSRLELAKAGGFEDRPPPRSPSTRTNLTRLAFRVLLRLMLPHTAALLQLWTQPHVPADQPASRIPEKFKVPFDFHYPMLKTALGEDLAGRLAAIEPGQPVGEADRKAVLAAFNRQRMPASRLLENPIVTYEKWDMAGFKEEGLCLNGLKYQGGRDGFWEVDQVKKVMDAGLVTYAPDGRHLKIKEGLSPQQSYDVEWAQVGIMSLAYGEVLSKHQFPKLKALGDHWYYFCR